MLKVKSLFINLIFMFKYSLLLDPKINKRTSVLDLRVKSIFINNEKSMKISQIYKTQRGKIQLY